MEAATRPRACGSSPAVDTLVLVALRSLSTRKITEDRARRPFFQDYGRALELTCQLALAGMGINAYNTAGVPYFEIVLDRDGNPTVDNTALLVLQLARRAYDAIAEPELSTAARLKLLASSVTLVRAFRAFHMRLRRGPNAFPSTSETQTCVVRRARRSEDYNPRNK